MINVDEQLYKWGGNLKLQEIDKTLETLFNNIFATNTGLEQIIIKVCVLNDLYSTQIFDTYSMAKHIHRLDIDRDLSDGDYNVVNKIACCEMGGKTKNFYSFASKYCAYHNPKKFAIYDSFVVHALHTANKERHFCDFKKSDLKDYSTFMMVIETFIEKHSLFKYSLKEIDKFLWTLGKELKEKQ